MGTGQDDAAGYEDNYEDFGQMGATTTNWKAAETVRNRREAARDRQWNQRDTTHRHM